MTGLKQIENQRAHEKALAEAKEEPAYKLLEELFNRGCLDNPGKSELRERVRVYLATGIYSSKNS